MLEAQTCQAGATVATRKFPHDQIGPYEHFFTAKEPLHNDFVAQCVAPENRALFKGSGAKTNHQNYGDAQVHSFATDLI